MNSVSHINDLDDMYTCECGSIFFNEIQAHTYLNDSFISYGPGGDLSFKDKSIKISKCILCNRVHIPRTSFAGRNALDRTVQLYATLYNQVQDYYNLLEEADAIKKDIDVETEQVSTQSDKDIVQEKPKRSTTRKTNKK